MEFLYKIHNFRLGFSIMDTCSWTAVYQLCCHLCFGTWLATVPDYCIYCSSHFVSRTWCRLLGRSGELFLSVLDFSSWRFTVILAFSLPDLCAIIFLDFKDSFLVMSAWSCCFGWLLIRCGLDDQLQPHLQLALFRLSVSSSTSRFLHVACP